MAPKLKEKDVGVVFLCDLSVPCLESAQEGCSESVQISSSCLLQGATGGLGNCCIWFLFSWVSLTFQIVNEQFLSPTDVFCWS